VRVPLGRGERLLSGYCVALSHTRAEPRRFKPIRDVLDGRALLSPSMLRLTRWMADHYLCPLGQVIEAVVPSGVRLQAGTRETLFVSLPSEVAARLAQLKLTTIQRRILSYLAGQREPVRRDQLARAVGCSAASIDTLRTRRHRPPAAPAAQSRSTGRARGDLVAAAGGPPPDDPIARGHGERQDGSLHAGD
jgi:primosomal protein N' (replication factor Y)